jgi:hypothetical protein
MHFYEFILLEPSRLFFLDQSSNHAFQIYDMHHIHLEMQWKGTLLLNAKKRYDDFKPKRSWNQKWDAAYWRGTNTGSLYNQEIYHQSHRLRLVKQFGNHRFIDVALTGNPVQCTEDLCKKIKEEYRYVGRVDGFDFDKYKYLIDVV